jgi:hypothetical protein
MLTYADVCRRMPTYADVFCARSRTRERELQVVDAGEGEQRGGMSRSGGGHRADELGESPSDEGGKVKRRAGVETVES